MAEEEPDAVDPGAAGNSAAKLRGHYAYYGVTDNSEGIGRFGYEVRELLFKWLNRRGKRVHDLGEVRKLLERYPLPKPRIMVNLFAAK